MENHASFLTEGAGIFAQRNIARQRQIFSVRIWTTLAVGKMIIDLLELHFSAPCCGDSRDLKILGVGRISLPIWQLCCQSDREPSIDRRFGFLGAIIARLKE